MKTVILTVGPQHVGKSTFCKKVIEKYPSLHMVSRDDILMELFGSVNLDTYSGGHIFALEKMWDVLKENLKEHSNIILDCWNGPDSQREEIIRQLRYLGVEKIGAWYVKTPREIFHSWCEKTILTEEPKKDPIWESRRKEGRMRDFLSPYDFFYKNATVSINQGFDFVVEINPTVEPSSFQQLFNVLNNVKQPVS